MKTKRPNLRGSQGSGSRRPAQRQQADPPIRLAHVLFVLWVSASVGWAFYAAKLAYDHGWWVERPELAAVLVLAPPILAYFLANLVIKLTGNPTFRS